jgi:signal transduction histidine kinase/ActR/RegA family two-component response regulator
LRPIRVYLLILVIGAMLPGALLTSILVWRAFANNRTVSERRLLESARVDASSLDREFYGTINILQALATSPALDADDLEAFHREGSRVQATQPGWYTVALVTPDGTQMVSTRLPWGTPLLSAADPESLARLVKTGQPVVGTIRPPQRGGPEHVFAIRIPVVKHGTLKYVLTAVVNVESLTRVVPPQQPNSEEWTRTILDEDATIAVRTRGAEGYIGSPALEPFRSRIRQTRESVSRETTREGMQVYAAFSRSAFGWTTVVVVSRDALDAPMRASMAGLITGGALLMLSGLVVALFISRRLSADLASATMAAEAVAEGHPLATAPAHVAETRRLQRSLTTAASLLEKRARERDDEMSRAIAARKEAEEANQTKDQFLAVLGHELRNPLAPALTALELMKARDSNTFRREREVLERQVAHMARLVNDLLDVSRLARGKVQLDRRRFELREAVDRAIELARPLIAQHTHDLQVEVPAAGLVINGDLDRIVQVLSNLLTNAAKYTPSGGHLQLSASSADDRVVIVCEDDGPGIPSDLMSTLFDPFAQGPRTFDRREGGLGLGLSLARTFTELHGGTIRVEPPASRTGTRFIVTLPRDMGNVTVPEETAIRVASGSVQRVLVVDDNADACEMLQTALMSAGHVVITAADGPRAIAMAAEFRPDTAVLDIGLPGMDGYELASRLRTTHPDIRLIALTGYGQAGDLTAAAAAGFDAHCAKPITMATLLHHIQAERTTRS